MELFYTEDYEGEMVSVASSWRDKNDPNKMTWVEKTVINDEHDGIAHVIGNATSRKDFEIRFLKGQTGGSQGVRSVGQSYGCNLLYKDFDPTFLICTNSILCDELAESGYCEDNIVYSNIKNILKHPDKFHLYPNHFIATAGTLATRMACADGHKTIYLLGMTTYLQEDDNIYIGENECYTELEDRGPANQKFTHEMSRLFLTYSDVQFYLVVKEKGLMPEAYNWCPNIKEISHMEYINLASLGAVAH